VLPVDQFEEFHHFHIAKPRKVIYLADTQILYIFYQSVKPDGI
jgi:hypothetical protein